MNKKNGSVLVTVSIVVVVVLMVAAIVFFWPKLTSKNGGATLTASSRENAHTLGNISFVVPAGGTEEPQQDKNSIKVTYPGGKFLLAILVFPSRLSIISTATRDMYSSVLGSSNFSSNYAYYSYLLRLTTSSVASSKNNQEMALGSALLAEKNASIIPMDSSVDISDKNQNGIKGVERTAKIHPNSPLIEVFDGHNTEYTFGFNDLSIAEAEAVFTSIQSVN